MLHEVFVSTDFAEDLLTESCIQYRRVEGHTHNKFECFSLNHSFPLCRH